MGITPALISGGLSLAGSLFGMANQGDKPQAPQGYQPGYQPWMDASYASGVPQLATYNTSAQTLPQYGQIAQGGVNNPYAGGYQAGSNMIAPMGWNAGLGQLGAGGATMASGLSMLPYSQKILQDSFDPLGSVYKQNFQQNTDQTRAGLEARGLNTSPFGAGVENQSNINFNNNWLNNLLGREATGAQGAATLNNSNVAAINAGTGIQTAGLNTLNNAASLPYSTSAAITGNQLGLLDRFGGAGTNATNTGQVSLQDMLAYLGYGNQNAGVANSGYANQITAQNNQFNQGQTLGKNLGAGLQGVMGNSFGGSGFNWGGGNTGAWGMANTGQPGSAFQGPVR